MTLLLNVNDVFRYVVGNTSIHPIEALIDFNRYEVMDFGLFDHATKTLINQTECFKALASQVSELRASAKNFDRENLVAKCESLCYTSVEIDLDSD